jgi:MFS family permease
MTDRFPGNRVIAGCFIVLTTSSGLGFYGLAVYLNAFSRERGWEVASVSLATTLFFFVSGLVGLVIAPVIARHDVRLVIVGGGFLAGGALAVLGQVEEKWQLYPVYAVFAVGWAGAGLVPVTTVITRWFHVRRSIALSVASTGLSAGGILITPAAKWLLDERGLAAGTPWLAVVWVLGTVPFALWLVRPDPAAHGWLPDGVRSVAGEARPVTTGTAFEEAVRTRFYVAVTIGYLLVLGAQVGAIQQLVRLAEERTDKSTASFATLVLAAMSVVARLIGGRVVTRLPMATVTVVLGVMQMVALIGIAFASSTVALFVAIVLFGATIGNILMLQPLLIAERFGVLDYPRIFSRSQFVTMFGTAGGPLVLGVLRDEAGGYRTSYVAAAACSLVGAAVLRWGGPATVVDS